MPKEVKARTNRSGSWKVDAIAQAIVEEMEAVGFTLDVGPSIDGTDWVLHTGELHNTGDHLDLFRRMNRNVGPMIDFLIARHKRNGTYARLDQRRTTFRWHVLNDPAYAGNLKMAEEAKARRLATCV